jgi:hypothetical protein
MNVFLLVLAFALAVFWALVLGGLVTVSVPWLPAAVVAAFILSFLVEPVLSYRGRAR